jgi:hypothetical protein
MAPLLLFIKPSMRIVMAFTWFPRPAVCAKTALVKRRAVRRIVVVFLTIEKFPLFKKDSSADMSDLPDVRATFDGLIALPL